VRECPSLPTDEIACWWEETKISTQLRITAGVCVLTTGLFIGSAGGAIAAADTETSGNTATSESQTVGQTSEAVGSTVPGAITTINSTGPVASTTNKPKFPISTLLQSVLQKLHSLGNPVQKQVVAGKPETDAVAPEAEHTQSADVTPAPVDPDASESNGVATGANPYPQATSLATPFGSAPTDVLTPTLEALRPVTNAVATVAGVALTVPGLVAGLPASQDPLGDVITSVQNMLVTVNDAVAPLAQVPGDLYSLMVAAAAASTVEPVSVVTSSRPGISAAASAGLTLPTTPVTGPILPIGPEGGMPLLGDVMAPATVGGIAAAGLSADLSLSATAPLAVGGAGPTDALSFLEHTVKAVLAPASLTALAAFALPGIAGLLIICAAGMRFGYRQAKAALAVRTSAISRFARQGPLGVVRSGSLVALHTRHPRALRVVRPSASRVTPLFEQAA
jgi:hypothetical protein